MMTPQEQAFHSNLRKFVDGLSLFQIAQLVGIVAEELFERRGPLVSDALRFSMALAAEVEARELAAGKRNGAAEH